MSDMIYKFLTIENAFRALEQEKLKISLIRELNDVYDCAPMFDPAEAGPEDDEIRSKFMQDMQGFGLICFSKSFRSPLLWGHYSSSATGIALGFDPQRLGWGDLIEVRYDSSRPVLSSSVLSRGTEEEKVDLIRRCFGTKAEEWAYEEEVRYILRLNLINLCEPHGGMYFAPFYRVALKQVVLGCRSHVKPSYVEHFLAAHFRGHEVSVHTARVHPAKFEMTVESAETLKGG